MKTLHLIRHAKSSWDSPGLADIDRPLNARGIKSCKIMAEPIYHAGCHFKYVYCSPAKRAQLTIEGINQSLPDKEIQWVLDDDLYTFSGRDLKCWCSELDDALDEVVLVGHNPAITDFCNDMGDRDINNVPTCAYVQLVFSVDRWQQITKRSARTEVFLTPKMLKKQ